MSGNQAVEGKTRPDLKQLADELIKEFTPERFERAEKAALETDRWDWVHFIRAFALQFRSEFEKAIDEYLMAIRIRPDFVGVYTNVGNCYFAMRQYEKAIEWYDKHITLFSLTNHGIPYTNRGFALLRLGEREAAATDFKIAIEADSTFEPAYRALIGLALDSEDKTKFDESVAMYAKAFQAKEDLSRELAGAYSQFATRLANSGRFDEAEKYLGRALELAPEHPGVVINTGYVRYKEKRLEDAKQLYEKALASDETRAGAHYNLAAVAALLGRTEEALRHLEAAIKLNARFKEDAKVDDDFSAMKQEAAFQTLIGMESKEG